MMNKTVLSLVVIAILVVLFLTYYKIIEAFNDNIDIQDDPCRIYLTEETKAMVLKALKGKLDELLNVNSGFKTQFEEMEAELAKLKAIQRPSIPTPPRPVTEVVVFEENQQGDKPTGTLSGVATYTKGSHIRLTPSQYNVRGHVYWRAVAGTKWSCSFDFRTMGGNGADSLWFFVYENSLSRWEGATSVGYNFVCDEYDNGKGGYGGGGGSSFQIHGPQGGNKNNSSIQTGGNYITHVAAGYNIDDGKWRNVVINFERVSNTSNHMEFWVDGKKVIDINHTPPAGKNVDFLNPMLMGFGGRTGGAWNNHDVRNMKLVRMAPLEIAKELTTLSLPKPTYYHIQVNQSYKGPQMRIRRSSDNAEVDVYIDASRDLKISGTTNNNLNSWLNGATAYIKTWYDQNGSSHFTFQDLTVGVRFTANVLQPMLVDANGYRVTYLKNPKPAVVLGYYKNLESTWGTSKHFVDPTAQWIWSNSGAQSRAPTNVMNYFETVYKNETNSIITATAHVIFDNYGFIHVNGKLADVSGGWGNPNYHKVPVSLYPGNNTITVFGINAGNSQNPAGILVSIVDSANKVLIRSDGSWKYELGGSPTQVSSASDGPWKCLSGFSAPMRKNKDGDIECMSLNNRNCTWGGPSCDSDLKTNPASIRPLTCGADHTRVWGGPGYNDPNHWCYKVRNILK